MAVESGGQRVAFTRDRVEELLRPELEDGTITWNDFERTKRFASVNRTYWPVCRSHKLTTDILLAKTVTGSLSAASMVYYGHWYRRPPWSKLSLLLIAPIAYTVGTFPGAIAQMLAVRRFRRDLEDPNGLLAALGRRVRLALTGSGDRDSKHIQSYPPSSVEDANSTSSSDSQGRWAEIRRASAAATTSTWDNIRQAHERPKTNQPESSDASLGHSDDSLGHSDDSRTEQAKFDALLEAERKISS
ncbi:hypothetical protein JB92DRAFT_3125972 [Gautieria morchelliformis]|nr:hypothetical protein JB92DRAFT_3125972 [Gautieria morchelliformis]